MFKDAKKEHIAIGEASTSYMWDKETPQRIHDCLPESKIIIMLRDPIERAFSNYLMDMRDGHQQQQLSFLEALQEDSKKPEKGWGVSNLYIERGFYYEQVKRYLELFSLEQVKVIIFEEFIKSPAEIVLDVIKFLEVGDQIPENVGIAYNSFYVPRNNFAMALIQSRMVHHVARVFPISIQKKMRFSVLTRPSEKPDIPDEARLYLQKVYYDDVSSLKTLLRRALPWSM